MQRKIDGIKFELGGTIIPEIENGHIKEYLPQSQYEKNNEIPVHKYGWGPFCKFSLPNLGKKEGVYIFFVGDKPVYVGECENLRKRINSQYGNISPRNCFAGGQETNCRVNHNILTEVKRGERVELFFYPVEQKDRKKMEDRLKKKLRPPWNQEIVEKPSIVPKTEKISRKGGTNKDKITHFLESEEGAYCDDCLSAILSITPRQTVNQICRPLGQQGEIRRERDVCSECERRKLVNWM